MKKNSFLWQLKGCLAFVPLAFAGSIFPQEVHAKPFEEWQQPAERTVRGKITDENGNGLPGVTIKIQGTTRGTVSDLDGNFNIPVPEEGAVLEFSFVGYVSEEISVNNRSVIDVSLEPDLQSLEEVVVVGYGTEKKKDLTGAVSSIGSKDFNEGVAVSPEQLIQGKAAGVNIVQDSGQPGSGSTVRIRGSNSISAGNDPLYVIDGVPLQFGSSNNFVSGMQGTSPFSSQPTNPLNALNPADIESIDILT